MSNFLAWLSLGVSSSFSSFFAGESRFDVRENTAFVDASMIYGSDKCEAMDLREEVDGRLNTSFPLNRRGIMMMMSSRY